jgi:hypothetical protein
MARIGMLIVVVALAAPAAASAYPGTQLGAGSLGVSGGTGTVFVQGQGVIFGYLDQGSLLVFSYRPFDAAGGSISVENARSHTDAGLVTYVGSGVRFLLPAGRYSLEIVGTGINLSAVGAGVVNVTGAGTGADGWIAFDGGGQISIDRVATPRNFGVAVP